MKISAKDEYGLRILLRIAESNTPNGMSIPQLSEAEGLSTAYVAKLTRLLRIAGLVTSTRGYKGGYVLSKPANEIMVNDIIKALDGVLFDKEFCNGHSGALDFCAHNVDCSVRSLWRMIQHAIDQLLDHITLQDLIQPELKSHSHMKDILTENQEMAIGNS